MFRSHYHRRKSVRIHFLFIIIALITICYQNRLVHSDQQLPTKPIIKTASKIISQSYRDRTIGCLFSDLCKDDQVCFDDNAFGRCEDYNPITERFSSNYVYQLDRKTIQLLEQELSRLALEGFGWPDPYTQCILKVILNDRPRIVYDPSQCDKLLFNPLVTKDINSDSDSISSKSSLSDATQGSIVDNDKLFQKIEQTLSKFLLPLSRTSSESEQEGRKIIKPSTNDLNKERLPISDPASSSVSSPSSSSSSSSSSSKLQTPSTTSILSQHPSQSQQQQYLASNILLSPPSQHQNSESISSLPLSEIIPKFQENSFKPYFLDDNYEKRSNRKPTSFFTSLNDNNNDNDNDSKNKEEYGDFNAQLNKGLIDYLQMVLANEYEGPSTEPSSKDILWQQPDGVSTANSIDSNNRIGDQFDFYQPDNKGRNNDQMNWMKLLHQQIGKEEKFYDQPDDAYRTDSNRPVSRVEFYDLQQQNDFQQKKAEKEPLILVYKVPEVRVIRDIQDDYDYKQEQLNQNEPSDLKLTPVGEDVVLVDLDDDLTNEPQKDSDVLNGNDVDYDDHDYWNSVFDGAYSSVNDNDEQEKALVEDKSDQIGNDNSSEEESEEDGENNKQEKEILMNDMDYINNYLIPNFRRNHRYDIKKPGPIYMEDYFFSKKSDPKQNTDKYEMKKSKDYNSNLIKKDFSLNSIQPVAEGPVKLDSKSDDTLIIRSASEGESTNLEAIDSTHTYVITDKILGEEDSERFLQTIEQLFNLPRGTFSNLRKEDSQITFKVNPNYQELNASQVASRIEDSAKLIKDITGYMVIESGIGDKARLPVVSQTLMEQTNERMFHVTILVCSIVLSIITGAFIIFVLRRNADFRERIKRFMKLSEEWVKFDYQDLCRQRFKNKNNSSDIEKNDGSKEVKCADGTNCPSQHQQSGGDNQTNSPPSRSSTSSWVEEPVSSNMDITTGHIILSYMEDHLKNKDRLDREWEGLCAYEADTCATNAALQKKNINKNRYATILPYDHSRVILNDTANVSNSDYINANTITDHDPRNPAYIATQGPLPNTKADFWQMIWEQGSVLIVMLTRLRENGLNMCDRYWPEEGSESFQNYEVHLVSEHIWCDDYLVRSFYLKNLKTGETRTVTQFHFLSWPENGVPPNTKSLLDFRRKVNKSYKGRSCPIVIHCNDGVGRTGTYILIDMVLNRLAKGAKEIDIAATLEHIRDQRCAMVKTKQQFEFALLAVADEVQAILKALPN